MRNRTVAIGILIIIFLGGVFGMRWYSGKQQVPVKGSVFPLVSAVMAKTEQRSAKLILTGTIEAYQETIVSGKLSGRVQQIRVEDGQLVQAGQPLILLESREAENSVHMAQAAVNQSRATLKDAQANASRYQSLYDRGAISEQQLSAALTKMAIDDAQYQLQLSSLDNAQEQLGHTTVTAPVTGYVANKSVVLGTVVNPGAMLMQVHDIASVYLTVSVQQKDIARITTGQKAEITADSYPGRVFPGSIDIINPAAGPNSRVFRVKIKIDNPDLALKPGMFAKGELVLGSPRDIVTVPQSAVVAKDGGSFVYVIADMTVKQTPISVGEIFERDVEVTGLSAGTMVVREGLHGLKDGDNIRLAN